MYKGVKLLAVSQLIGAALLILLHGVGSAWATESLTFIHTDVAGSTVAATDSNGNIIWREAYRPYGERLIKDSASGGNREFFHGKAFDVGTELSYFGARYYDPIVGRFMGVDPKGFTESNPVSFNRFAYANNSPFRFSDQDGREAFELNLVLLGGTFGTDSSTGHPFWKIRAGLVGLGWLYFADYDFSIEGRQINVGDCARCSAKAESQGANVSFGAKVGVGSLLQLKGYAMEYQKQVVNIESAGGAISTEIHGEPTRYLFGEIKTGGPIGQGNGKGEKGRSGNVGTGAKISVDANFEWGRLVPWSSVIPDVKSHRDSNF